MKRPMTDAEWMMNSEPEIISLRNKYKPIYSVLSNVMCMIAGGSAYAISKRFDGKESLIYNITSVCIVTLVIILLRYVLSVIEDVHCSSRYKDICHEKMMRIYDELTTNWTATIEVHRDHYYTYKGVVGTMDLLYSIKDKLIGDVYSVSSTDAEYYWDGHDWRDVKELLHDPCKEQNKIDCVKITELDGDWRGPRG